MKRIIILISILFTTNFIFADGGIYQSYGIFFGNSLQYFDVQATTTNPDFNNANLGAFNINESYFIKGGEVKTWKNNGGDITGAYMYYRIYDTNSAAPEFQEISLPWTENGIDGNSNNQKWQRTDQNINILSGLSAGNYKVEIYFKATSNEGDKYSNNSGANYIATFTILQRELNLTSVTALTETNLDNGEITVTLVNETFVDTTLSQANFTLLNAPFGTTIEEVIYNSSTSATIKLAYNSTDFDSDIPNFGVAISANELTGNLVLLKQDLNITAIVEDEILLNGKVTISPSLPTRTQQVTITLNTTGTVLENETKIYFHSGVGMDRVDSYAFNKTIGNWGEDDGVGEMTKIGTTNNWTITLTSINDYYSLQSNDDAFALNFLFRNASGLAKEDNNASNYHLTINPTNYFLISSPSYNPFLVETLQNFNISATANTSINWVLKEVDEFGATINANIYSTVNQIFSFNHFLSDTDITHYYQLSADFGSETKTKNFEVKAYSAITNLTVPAGAIKGINYNFPNSNDITFVLHTPTNTTFTYFDNTNCSNTSSATTQSKNVVHLIGDFNNWTISDNYKLNNDGDYWWITINSSSLTPVSDEYVFQYLVDGQIKIGDPYSTKVSDPDDQYITNTIYPNLINYPSNKTSGRATVLQLNKPLYNWKIHSFQRNISSNNLNIYELHFRDFTEEGTYKAATAKLDYIKNLGINCIHVMPVSEFEGNNSWGYNPNYYFAADKAYGPENDLKEFIDEAHVRGIAVVNDLVLNHAFYSNPNAMLYWDNSLNKPSNDNPWFNPNHKGIYDSTGHWGADWNHASEHTQNLVDDILNYWIEEFKFDGFRFDFTKGFTQSDPNPSDPWASTYNNCRIEILKRMIDKMWENHPNTYAIFEHLADDNEDKVLADHGILMWSGAGPQHSWTEMAMGTTIQSFWSSVYASRNFNFANYMSYMESHDEERVGYKVKTWGQNNDTSLTYLSNRLKLPAAFNLLLPGPRMIWQFGELGYDISIDQNGRTGEKTSAWELNYHQDIYRTQIYNLYSQIFKFRNNYNLYQASNNPDYGNIGSTTEWTRRMSLNDNSLNSSGNPTQVIAIGNFDSANDQAITPGYSYTGNWFKYNGNPAIDGTKYTVNTTSDSFVLYKNDPVYILSNADIIAPSISPIVYNIESTSACNYTIQSDEFDYSQENWVPNVITTSGKASDNGTISKLYYNKINTQDIANEPSSLTGEVLQIGENIIQWIVEDSFGNKSSCLQTINITTNVLMPNLSFQALTPISEGSNTTINIQSPNPNFTYNWYANEYDNTPIAIGNSYTTPALTNTTNYWVEAIDSNLCKSNKVKIEITVQSETLSVDDFDNKEHDIIFYPNPTSGAFEITLPVVDKEIKIAMYNTYGQLISQKTYPVISGKVQLSIDQQPAGLYLAKVYAEKPFTLKIVKK